MATQTSMTEQLCISVEQMAELLGVSLGLAYNLARSAGFYPSIRIGKRIVINRAALERWLDQQSADGPDGFGPCPTAV